MTSPAACRARSSPLTALGKWAGALLAPVTGGVSFMRRSRMFHPTGTVCRAEIEVVTSDPAAREVAERLGKVALARWSSAWWKRREWVDVLGCALRFTDSPGSTGAAEGDQDLLFATIRRPWTLPFAPFVTKYHDFLSNHYYAVSPFEVPPLGRVEWRLTPEPGARAGGSTRAIRLASAIRSGGANLLLEWSGYRKPWRAFDERSFQPLARVRLVEVLELEQRSLGFDPFRAGRGLTPVGFVHGLRRLTYAASRSARPA